MGADDDLEDSDPFEDGEFKKVSGQHHHRDFERDSEDDEDMKNEEDEEEYEEENEHEREDEEEGEEEEEDHAEEEDDFVENLFSKPKKKTQVGEQLFAPKNK